MQFSVLKQPAPLHILYKQRADRIDHRNDHNSYVCKDRKPHIRNAQSPKKQADYFDANGKYNILIYDAKTFP